MPALFLLLCFGLLQGCRYPQDVEGTLDTVRGGVLDVGVTENPPWVIRSGDNAQGLEPEIVRSLADQLNADVRWHWGSESQLLRALKRFQLDLVIGGIAKNKWISMAAAPTKPYVKVRSTVGFPEGQAVPESLDGMTVGVSAVNHLAKALSDQGAVPEIRDEPQQPNGAFAGPGWWLRAHGYEPGPFKLTTDKHVMLLPKGENAWMMAVEEHLNSLSGLERRLQQLEAEL
ncbi:substrate-binding periplasmic protein [Marinobacter salicampi]|uniref:substrate-binding periplasmic protein n=1 Tax=Marinobacter salicampi TaxID=435907 RepID=UPI0014093D63|nr:transporter substrate-binding domain-containing protein [Marinobacter salicampi]